MRKFALLFAFVLALCAAGSAFAADVEFVTIGELQSWSGDPVGFNSKFSSLTTNGGSQTVEIMISSDKAVLEDFRQVRSAIEKKLDYAAGGRYSIHISIDDQTEIPPGAFDGDKFLIGVTLTSDTQKLKTIGANAFANTENLVSIKANGSVAGRFPPGLEIIGDRAFYNTELNTALSFEGVKKIGKEAFAANAYLGITGQVITWGDSTGAGDTLEEIDDGAFKGSSLAASPLTASSTALTKLRSIGNNAFENTKLNDITLTSAAALTKIGDAAFKGIETMNGASSPIALPVGLQSLGKEAFAGVRPATKGNALTIDLSGNTNSSFTEIPESAFRDSKFTEIKVMDRLTKIGDYAFSGITTTASGGFTVKDSADNVGFKETKLETIGAYAFAESGLLTNNSDFSPNSISALSLPGTIKEIGDYAFYRAGKALAIFYRADETDYNPATPAAFNASLPTLGRGAFANMDQDTEHWFNIDGVEKKLDNTVFSLPYDGDNADAPETVALVSALAKAGLPALKIRNLTGFAISVIDKIVNAVDQGSAPVITTKETEFAAKVGVAFSQPLTASGSAPITWTLDKGDKSQELVWLNITNGVLNGTPTVVGEFKFTVTVANAYGRQNDVPFTVKVSSGGDTPTGGSGSTGGSGGCAAGFAPIAALFVLGALKLRKGR